MLSKLRDLTLASDVLTVPPPLRQFLRVALLEDRRMASRYVKCSIHKGYGSSNG